jgi:enterochelin esterase family protein
MNWRTKLVSSRVAALMADPSPEAVASFWIQVEGSGTPLIEEIPGDPAAVCVTFVHRGSGSEPQLTLSEGIAFGEPKELALQHLPGTDVWHLSLRLPRASRVTYGFSPNSGVSPFVDDAELGRRYAARRSDRFNPQVVHYPTNPDQPQIWGRSVSLLELPEARRQEWLDVPSHVPRGTVRKVEIQSRCLGKPTNLFVYEP